MCGPLQVVSASSQVCLRIEIMFYISRFPNDAKHRVVEESIRNIRELEGHYTGNKRNGDGDNIEVGGNCIVCEGDFPH